MELGSYIFVLYFLPAAIIGYFSLQHFQCWTLAKLFLIGMSLFFYWYANSQYLLLLVGIIAFNYIISTSFARFEDTGRKRRILLIVALAVNLCTLFYFKYSNFFIETLNSILSQDYFVKQFVLPLGISFGSVLISV